MTSQESSEDATISRSIPIISLFSGCGAFDLGFSKAGFRALLALDINAQAVASYNRNRKTAVAQVGDLSKLDADDLVSILSADSSGHVPRGVIGGSPCQSFSCSNVHVKSDDVRHELPKKFASILAGLNAQYDLDFFIFENVRGLTYRKHHDTFTEFKRLFEEAGFRLFEGLLDAADFGVAQHRPRVFVVGLNAKKFPTTDFEFPYGISEQHRTVRDLIGQLPDPTYFSRDLQVASIQPHPNHWTMQPRSSKFSSGELVPGHKNGRSFRVLNWDKPSWTVAYGNREIHVHPSGRRRLSVYEAMLLQGLPSSYVLSGNLSEQIRQVSDAVPPQLGEALGKAIAVHINS